MDSLATTNSAIVKFTNELSGMRETISASRPLMLNYVLENSRPGDIQNVIDTMDKFAQTEQWVMNLGDKKGEILDQALQSRRPKTVLELGKD
ncbi:unnamed protein product [Rotaria socialis]|uniref:Uncharacterized protein n=1 Tax=Rotaria socialis TaxID=392032 RepID=A0A818JP81_9BILA|nr:unnamed protein product [Rotaria socialis]CAF3543174.1 unnamed protein product [Rotaria socialis]CAF4536351.1 unnamed protein product [Rotaria socialis]CAF4801466.1 unnamed protein product [Rotaria socialis]